MNGGTLRKAVQLSEGARILVATADPDGMPHLAAAGKLIQSDDDHVAITEWFCPGTVANVNENPRVAVVVWDPGCDLGYQLLGQVETVDEMAVLNGYSAEAEAGIPRPQVARRLLVRVGRILDFKRAPHTDVVK